MRRWRGWSTSWRETPFLAGDAVSLADVALLAYTRAGASRAAFHLDGLRRTCSRWIGEAEECARACRRGALTCMKSSRLHLRSPSAVPGATTSRPSSPCWRTIALGGPRERIEDPLPPCLFHRVRDGSIAIRTSGSAGRRGAARARRRLSAALHPAGRSSSQGRSSRGLIEDVRVASIVCRSRGIDEQLVQWAADGSTRQRLQVRRIARRHNSRVDAQRFYERLGFARSHVGMTAAVSRMMREAATIAADARIACGEFRCPASG